MRDTNKKIEEVSVDTLMSETVLIRSELLKAMRIMRINGVRQGEQEVLELLKDTETRIQSLQVSLKNLNSVAM